MKEKIALISVGANLLLGLVKIVAGVLSGSVAVLSEGIHSGVDVLSSGICLFGIKVAKKPVDKNHPYGHYKFEVLAGEIITFILAVTGIFIVWQSYKKFAAPEKLVIDFWALGVMGFSAVINEIMARLKISYGKKENAVSLISEGVHSRVDVFSSLAIFIGLILAPYWQYADPLLALLVGLYILKESFSLGKETTDSLLDVSAGEEIENKIREIVNKSIEISEIKTQKKGSAITANLKIKLPNDMTVKDASTVADSLREKLMREVNSLTYVAIQIESHDLSTSYYKPLFGLGKGFGWQRHGRMREVLKEAQAKGPGGDCVCPQCGFKVEHQRGVPCTLRKCPQCGTFMIRR